LRFLAGFCAGILVLDVVFVHVGGKKGSAHRQVSRGGSNGKQNQEPAHTSTPSKPAAIAFLAPST
jgi:hypothetical protein